MKLKTLVLFTLSLLIVSLGQPAFVPWLAPIAAVCGFALFWTVAQPYTANPKVHFVLSFLWFSFVQFIQLSWMTSIEYQGVYILIVYTLLSCILGAQFGLLTILMRHLPMVATAAMWVLMEWIRFFLFCGFSWNPVGMGLASYLYPLQFASLFGILGLSFWVILTNLAVYKKKWKPAAALAIIPYIFGFSYTSYHQPKLDQSPVLKGALVQTALLPSQKLYLEHKSYDFISPYEQWSRIAHLLSQVKEKVDLVVLPESAVALNDNTPFYSRQRVVKILQTAFKTSAEAISALGPQVDRVSNRFWMNALTKIIQSDIVMGIDTEDHGHYFSSALFSSYERNQTQKYDKQLLLPLAEYLPFESLRSLTAMYGITDFFTPGKEVMIFQSKVPLSASICYEETFGHILRKGRKKGARLFVNLTNDNWYPSSRLPKQHFDLARVHTVANGTPLLRACNAGVTSSLDSLGQVIGQLNDWNQPAVLVTTVPLYQIKTLYAMWGDAGIVSLSIFILGVLLFINRKSIFVRID